MKRLSLSLYISTIITLLVTLLSQTSADFDADAADRSWRYNKHSRNIDINICIKYDSPIPGPPGPQGPPGEEGPPGPPGPVEPIGTDNIEDGAVTSPKLADSAVTTDKI